MKEYSASDKKKTYASHLRFTFLRPMSANVTLLSGFLVPFSLEHTNQGFGETSCLIFQVIKWYARQQAARKLFLCEETGLHILESGYSYMSIVHCSVSRPGYCRTLLEVPREIVEKVNRNSKVLKKFPIFREMYGQFFRAVDGAGVIFVRLSPAPLFPDM